jgi:hypothetical protein
VTTPHITAACFPTPHLALTTTNPDDQARIRSFADRQATAARAVLGWLTQRMSTPMISHTDHADRIDAISTAYGDLLDWRYTEAQQTPHRAAVGFPPDALRFATPIDVNYDRIGTVGRLREGARWDPDTRTYRGGTPTPASEQMDLIGRLADARFAVEVSGADEVVNWVRLPSGCLVAGSTIVRGTAARTAARTLTARAAGRGMDVARFEDGGDPMYTVTAPAATRTRIRDHVFELLAAADVMPDPLSTWAWAAYLLYQAPEMKKGSDAVARTFLVAVGTYVTGRALILPQDIDLRAYVLDQATFQRWLTDTVQEVTG